MADTDLETGERFRGLLIRGELGTGGMGAVYLASHTVLRTSLVVKRFRVQADDEQPFREARLAARVSSPHVVDVIDAGLDEQGEPYLVERYVDGVDLAELLTRMWSVGWQLRTGVIARFLCDVARGLHALHQAGVVHRDIKPANIFLDGEGQAMIGDLGLAVDPDIPGRAHMFSGTPQFMAPEQWQGTHIDNRTDVYALGCTAHMMVVGTTPFEGLSPVELARVHVEEPYVPPAHQSPEEAYLLATIERMLQKKPHQRPSTTDEVADLLERIAAPEVMIEHGVDWALMGDVMVSLRPGDISTSETDVIVNAANWRLRMEVGVAGALKAAAGSEVETEAMAHAPQPMGAVVWTHAGQLNVRWIAHAVSALDGAICLQRCVLRVLLEAEARQCTSVSFPALGTGVGDVPMSQAAALMTAAVRTFAWLRPTHMRDIRFVLHTEPARDVWRRVLRAI